MFRRVGDNARESSSLDDRHSPARCNSARMIPAAEIQLAAIVAKIFATVSDSSSTDRRSIRYFPSPASKQSVFRKLLLLSNISEYLVLVRTATRIPHLTHTYCFFVCLFNRRNIIVYKFLLFFVRVTNDFENVERLRRQKLVVGVTRHRELLLDVYCGECASCRHAGRFQTVTGERGSLARLALRLHSDDSDPSTRRSAAGHRRHR